ncbi:hypothetical protein BDB01DRAFT_852153 [Pilobolus umbonatus]|nr:hypothetical protein BDB01DRAFT_852153 [Pilobolus umbonatus]
MEAQFEYNSNNNASQQVIKLKLNNNSGEFTRRKNWSQSILESIRDVIHVLNQEFKIIYCSPASSEFLGYKPAELVNHLFTDFVHLDDVDMFMRELRNAQNMMQPVKVCYRFLRKDGKYTTMETTGQFYKNSFFGNARKIPTEATQTMDTLLDLKLENEKLKKQIQAIRNQQGMNQAFKQDKRSLSDSTGGSGTNTLDEDADSVEEYDDYKMPTNPNVYTQGVHPSYDVLESVSLFTGLRYDLGERSVGISMGLENGELTTITPEQILYQPVVINNNEIHRTSEDTEEMRAGKKKRLDDGSPKICTDCGTTDAPEWRRGPKGPKTLCNACGIRWSKGNKKMNEQKSNN